MAFNYVWHQLIYLHDIKSYYCCFVLKTLGKEVVSFIDVLLKLRKIKMPCQSTMKTWIFCTHQSACIHFCNILFWHGSTMYYSLPIIFHCWAWVYPHQEDIVYLVYFLVWLAGAFQFLLSRSYSLPSFLHH